jgi:hypothetical protein
MSELHRAGWPLPDPRARCILASIVHVRMGVECISAAGASLSSIPPTMLHPCIHDRLQTNTPVSAEAALPAAPAPEDTATDAFGCEDPLAHRRGRGSRGGRSGGASARGRRKRGATSAGGSSSRGGRSKRGRGQRGRGRGLRDAPDSDTEGARWTSADEDATQDQQAEAPQPAGGDVETAAGPPPRALRARRPRAT